MEDRPDGRPGPKLSLPELFGLFVLGLGARLLSIRAGAPPSEAEIAALRIAYSAGRSGLGPLRVLPEDPASSDLLVTILTTVQPALAGSDPQRAALLLETDPDPIVHGTRVLVAVLGALAVALTAIAAERSTGRGGGWIAGLLVAFAPFAVGAGAELRPASLLVLAGAVCALGIGRLASGGGLGSATLAGAGAGLASAAGTGGGAVLLAFPWAIRGRSLATPWIAGALAAAAVWMLAAPGEIVTWLTGTGDVLVPHRDGSPLIRGAGVLRIVAGLLPLLLGLAGAALAVLRRDRTEIALATAATFATGGTLLRSGASPDGLALVLPFVAILAAAFVTRGPLAVLPSLRFAVVALAVAAGLVGSAQTILAHRAKTVGEEAVEWIRRNAPEGAPILDESGGRLAIPTMARAEELDALAAAGEIPERVRDRYRGRKLFQTLPLRESGVPERELVLRYDPRIASRFPLLLLEDEPGLADGQGELAEYRVRFRDMVREEWQEAARFEPRSRSERGVSLHTPPPDPVFRSDPARNLLLRLRGSQAEVTRDTSRVNREWLLEAGAMLRSVGRLADARDLLQSVVERDSTNAEVRFQLGLVYLLSEEYAAAKRELLAGLYHDPRHGGIHFNLGTLLEADGDLAGAETEYRAATVLLEAPAPAHARLGALLARLGDMEAAREELRRVRQLDPGGEAEDFLAGFLADP